MSAECSRCGMDLVHGDEWPGMFCSRCRLGDKLTRTQEHLSSVWLTLKRLVDKLYEVDEASAHIFLFAANHGVIYRGPAYRTELKEAERVLEELKTR